MVKNLMFFFFIIRFKIIFSSRARTLSNPNFNTVYFSYRFIANSTNRPLILLNFSFFINLWLFESSFSLRLVINICKSLVSEIFWFDLTEFRLDSLSLNWIFFDEWAFWDLVASWVLKFWFIEIYYLIVFLKNIGYRDGRFEYAKYVLWEEHEIRFGL